jgi:hypothetical protein
MHNFSCSGTPRADPAKKCAGTRYAKLVFLHLMESVGHAMRAGALGRKTSVHYFSCSVRPVWIAQTALGHVMSNL